MIAFTRVALLSGVALGLMPIVDCAPGQFCAGADEQEVTPEVKLVREFEKHGKGVNSVAFSPDGKRLASVGSDGMIRVWDVATGRELQALPEKPAKPLGVCFDPEGKALITTNSRGIDDDWTGYLSWWDLETQKVIRRVSFDSYVFLVPSEDRTMVATSSGIYGGHRIRLWDTRSGKELRSYTGDVNPDTVAFSPDGQLLAIVSRRRGVQFWNLETTKYVRGIAEIDIRGLAFSPKGDRVAWTSDNPDWDPPDQIVFERVDGKGKRMWVNQRCDGHLRFSKDGQWLFAGWYGALYVLDTEAGKVVRRIVAHNSRITSIVLSPDGELDRKSVV